MTNSKARAAIAALFVVLPILLTAACSSAPPPKQQIDDTKNRAAQYVETGNNYYRLGEYAQALRMFQSSLDLNLSVDNRAGVVLSYNSIGKGYLAIGDAATAEKAFQKAVEVAGQLRSADLETESKLNLAEFYLQTDKTDQALPLLAGLAAAATPTGDPAQAAVVYHDLGTAYARKSDFGKATDYLKQALAINEKLKRVPEQASNHYMLASVYSRQNLFSEAASEIDAALALDKKWENSPGIAEDLYAAGRIAERSNDEMKAYGYYRRSLSVFSAINSKAGAAKTLEALIATARALGRAGDAAGYEKMLQSLRHPAQTATP